MSLLLNTGAMHYRENANEEWKPLVIKADVDIESLADPYSTSSTYSVGEYCTRDGKFYRCKTAISTAEAWNSSHWQETTIGQELESKSISIDFASAITMESGIGLGSGSTFNVKNKHAFLFLKGDGSLTSDSDGTIRLGTIASAYRPEFSQMAPCRVNIASSGQIIGNMPVMIFSDGTLRLYVGEANKTFGTSSYPWTTSGGSFIDWEL